MRILIAGANRSAVGGAETYQRSLIPALEAAGHEVALLREREPVPGRPTVDPPDADLPVWCTATDGGEVALKEASRWAPDVAYTHGLASVHLEAALQQRIGSVLFAHGYYGTCAAGTKRHAFPRTRSCARRIGAACLLLHYPRRCGGLHPVTMVRDYRTQHARLRLVHDYRATCVASEHMLREYRRHGIASERLHRLPLPPPGIVPDAAAPEGDTCSGRLLLSGRLTNMKGGRVLLAALPEASRRLGRALTVTFLGDGPERDTLERQAGHLGIAASFFEWLDFTERNALLQDMELVAVPSLFPEPWGLVGLEAGCVGVPAVAYAAGGIPDWLTPGESGELAPTDPPTAAGLTDAIVRALGDRAHYRRLSRGAWEQARRFTMEAHLAQLLPILDGARGS
ncbi:MAG: glycosyltransferase family 4 protein [Planctomycetota bacterium]